MTNENITVVGYRRPAIEGSIIYFICPPQLDLSGSRTSTCSADGQWKPDPREVECKGDSLHVIILLLPHVTIYNNIITNTHNINIVHEEDNEPRPLMAKVPVLITASVTITVFIVTAIIFFAIGFLCRHLVYQRENNQDKLTTPSSINVQDAQKDAQQSHELELQTNVAYENVTMN